VSTHAKLNKLLGYSAEARLLIVNADDFGMCHAENEATIRAIQQGLASSCTLMVPCPWARHGMHLLKQNPDIPFGIHLTIISEYAFYRWGPLTCSDKVPSLVDESGCFYSEERIPELLAQVDLDELRTEFRAQIEAVLQAGLLPTHLDTHCDIDVRHEGAFDTVLALAQEYGLALRVSSKPLIDRMQRLGLPANDHALLDSYDVPPADKPAYYLDALRNLPPGLTEWALHPAGDSAELRAIVPTWPARQADLDFLLSVTARQLVEQESIHILNYKPLQELWRVAA
jgi:predicted glycoside hydrolase/deacetylase ChbG (UPF0249 family)